MTARRRAREAAVQILYAMDGDPAADPAMAVAQFFQRFAAGSEDDDDGDGDPGDAAIDRAFLDDVVRGVAAQRPALDEMLTRLSRNWRIERMARVDRSILRLALYELAHRPDVPSRVTLDEAIELAKTFGADEAPAFVNGLLDSALKLLNVNK